MLDGWHRFCHSSRTVRLKHYMHQSQRRHSRVLWMLIRSPENASASLRAAALHYLLLAERLPVRSALPPFSISACLCLSHIHRHFSLSRFDVFRLAAHLRSELYITWMARRNGFSCFHTLHQPVKYWWRVHIRPDNWVGSLHHCRNQPLNLL